MKNLVLLACLLVASVAAYPCEDEAYKKQMQQHMRQLFESCMNEVGITDEEKQKIIEKRYEEIDETKRNCMSACFLKKQGVMEGSEIKLDKIHEGIEKAPHTKPELKETLKTITSECHKEASSIENECEKAGKYANCVRMQLEQHSKSTEEQAQS